MISKWRSVIWCGILTLALFALVVSNQDTARAQGDAGINFIAFACPYEGADLSTECDILTGAVFDILADGAPLSGSPFTTEPTSLVPGFFFNAPSTATLTITELGGNPAGYAPAAGFDPLIIDVGDIPIGGCGGESTCPTIEFINLPFAVADGPADDSSSSAEGATSAEVVVLPATGTGSALSGNSFPGTIELAMLLALLSMGLAIGGRVVPAGYVRR